MKTLLLFVSLVFAFFNIKAQVTDAGTGNNISTGNTTGKRGGFPYTFSVSTGTYTNLSGAISLNNGLTWDDPEFIIPIGFKFQYFNITTDTIFIDSNFTGSTLATNNYQKSTYPVLFAYGPDLIDRASDTNNLDSMTGSLSPISYQLTGTAGSRILKIEWKNAGFFNEVWLSNTSVDYVNLQLWLYESSNDIEIHFGPNSIKHPLIDYDAENGPYIGLMPMYDYDIDTFLSTGLWLTGNPSSPTPVIVDSLAFLNNTVPNGTIYKFTKVATGLNNNVNENNVINIYPNPSKNNFMVQGIKANTLTDIFIYDQVGELVRENVNIINNSRINVGDLTNGVYIVKIKSGDNAIFKKLIINN